MMKSEIKEVSPTQKELSIEIDGATLKATYAKVTQKYARGANVPGFRKGYAPDDIVRMRYKEEIKSEVLQEVVPTVVTIVSVSGFHVGLVAGVVFFLFKKLLSLFPFIALKFDTRKIAATISILFITYYTFFTGAEAPALRALIMTSVMLIGIILNRKAISMRGLIVAAMILVAISPENALDSGFLMSFLATMALVSLWEFNEIKQFLKPKNPFEIVIFWIFGAALTSLVAGIATIPISLNNFQSLQRNANVAQRVEDEV